MARTNKKAQKSQVEIQPWRCRQPRGQAVTPYNHQRKRCRKGTHRYHSKPCNTNNRTPKERGKILSIRNVQKARPNKSIRQQLENISIGHKDLRNSSLNGFGSSRRAKGRELTVCYMVDERRKTSPSVSLYTASDRQIGSGLHSAGDP